MEQHKFDSIYELLPPKRKRVLLLFLSGKSDDEIMAVMEDVNEVSGIRSHISNLCQDFGFINDNSEKYSHRDKLIALFVRFKPELVAPSVRGRVQTPPPIPEPDIPGSLMEIDSPFYIDFSEESRCCEEIQRAGGLVRIRSPHLTGKTSLFLRILNFVNGLGYRTVYLNLRKNLSLTDLEDLAHFLYWFSKRVSESLELEQNTLPDNMADLTNYFQNQVLLNAKFPLVLVLDEADFMFEHPEIAEDFFGLLRGWHNDAKIPGLEIWKQLRQVIIHSTDVYCRLDKISSPFDNVGYVTQHLCFDEEQSSKLGDLYRLDQWTPNDVKRLREMVGGHPYLIHKAVYELLNMPLDKLLQSAPTLTGIYRSHLQALSDKLQASRKEDRPEADLHDALKKVIESEGNAVQLTLEQTFKLEGLGLVQLQGNQVKFTCKLYHLFFRDLSTTWL